MTKSWVYICLLSASSCGRLWIVLEKATAVSSISPSAVAVSLGQSVQFQVTLPAGATGTMWSVNGISGGNSTVGTVDGSGKYTAPSDTQSVAVTVTAASGSASSSSVSAQVFVVAPGTVEPTQNPQVAIYTITPPAAANVTVQFGPTTSYGLSTWTQGLQQVEDR